MSRGKSPRKYEVHIETIYPSEDEEKLRSTCRNEGQFLWRVKLAREQKWKL